ncbi:hypothetical protein GP486_001163 [Trichoglossum hirsutum]|uniref:C2H2-type domain-containing protein n=1 Tax=Trichoglossum hirsutum TaxID=265104 RepID=A0A9P8LH71_9PEZI|nr:hypothetical protein GP486_001163 [Trichoglossum hirsutum]
MLLNSTAQGDLPHPFTMKGSDTGDGRPRLSVESSIGEGASLVAGHQGTEGRYTYSSQVERDSPIRPMEPKDRSIPQTTLHQEDIRERLLELGIVYHQPYGLFACLDCVKTLYGTHLVTHLRKDHQYDKRSVAFVESNLERLPGVVKSHLEKDKPWPTTVIPALKGILVEQGYHCQFCNAAYHTDNAMKTHLRKKHTDYEQRQWWRRKLPMGPMQSFSIGNRASGSVWKSPSFQVSIEASEIGTRGRTHVASMPALGQELSRAEDKPNERGRRYLGQASDEMV